jgi:hypothetical protein
METLGFLYTKSPPPGRALRLICEFPHITQRATQMMGSLCSLRFSTIPPAQTDGLGLPY